MPEPERTSPKAGEVVYVLGTPGTNTVKIGRTIDLTKRMADIQRMSPVPLEVLWTHPGGCDLESKLHRQFSALRTHGEWFTFGSDPAATISWAVREKPWLRPKVRLKKKVRRARITPPTPASESLATRDQIADALGEVHSAWGDMLSAIGEIENPTERFDLLTSLESEIAHIFRVSRQQIALELKRRGWTWRAIGEAMGGVSAQRAHQLSLGGDPLYGVRAEQP